MKTLTQSLKTLVLALVLALGVSYVSAWTAPTATPTGGNVASPLNTSVNAQYKKGALGIGLSYLPTAMLEIGGTPGVDGIKFPDGTVQTTSSEPPTVDFFVSKNPIYRNETATLWWRTTNAKSCFASNGWTGTKPLSGTVVIAPYQATNYTLTCTNEAGLTSTKNIDMVVSDRRVYLNAVTPARLFLNTYDDFSNGPYRVCQEFGYRSKSGTYPAATRIYYNSSSCKTASCPGGYNLDCSSGYGCNSVCQGYSPSAVTYRHNGAWGTTGFPAYGANWCNQSDQYVEWVDC